MRIQLPAMLCRRSRLGASLRRLLQSFSSDPISLRFPKSPRARYCHLLLLSPPPRRRSPRRRKARNNHMPLHRSNRQLKRVRRVSAADPVGQAGDRKRKQREWKPSEKGEKQKGSARGRQPPNRFLSPCQSQKRFLSVSHPLRTVTGLRRRQAHLWLRRRRPSLSLARS